MTPPTFPHNCFNVNKEFWSQTVPPTLQTYSVLSSKLCKKVQAGLHRRHHRSTSRPPLGAHTAQHKLPINSAVRSFQVVLSDILRKLYRWKTCRATQDIWGGLSNFAPRRRPTSQNLQTKRIPPSFPGSYFITAAHWQKWRKYQI